MFHFFDKSQVFFLMTVGNHLYPMELENIIKKHPGVAQVAVFGLPEPKVQELVTAIVVKDAQFSVTIRDSKKETRHKNQ